MATYSNPGVYVSESLLSTSVTRATTAQSVATFFGQSDRGPTDATFINSWAGFKSAFGDINVNYELGYSLYHYFANGGRDAYVVRVTGASASSSTSTVAYNPNGVGQASASLFTATAQNVGTWGNSLTAIISAGVTTASATQIPTFNLSVRYNGVEVEKWNEVSTDPANNRYLESVINTYSKYIRVTVATGAKAANSAWAFNTSTTFSFSVGSNGTAVASSDYVTALSKLDVIEGNLLLNAPGQTAATVVNGLIAKAESRSNSFVIIDPSTETDPTQISSAVVGLYTVSSYAAVYYPMLKMVDPAKTGPAAVRNTYPGGAVAGAYIRAEIDRTVAKAPAGYSMDIRNSFGLVTNFTSTQTGTLYDTYGVNLFKAIPGGGIIVNGTRTLDKTTPGKYIPIRRSLNYVKQGLKDVTAFAIFEPNDDRLWTAVNLRIGAFLAQFWRDGGLKGRNAAEAFYVVCNETNNTAESIAQGEVRIEVGVALQYPAEFIVINVSQWTGGSNAVSSL